MIWPFHIPENEPITYKPLILLYPRFYKNSMPKNTCKAALKYMPYLNLKYIFLEKIKFQMYCYNKQQVFALYLKV